MFERRNCGPHLVFVISLVWHAMIGNGSIGAETESTLRFIDDMNDRYFNCQASILNRELVGN